MARLQRANGCEPVAIQSGGITTGSVRDTDRHTLRANSIEAMIGCVLVS
jgi:hypothetical protein